MACGDGGPVVSTSLPVDRSGLEMMPLEECLYHLRTARMGRLAFVWDGYPIILPVNHGMQRDSVVFRTNVGSKLAAADNEMPVAFEVDAFDADRRAGWSVIVRGDAQTIEDPADLEQLHSLGVWPWADAVERDHWVRINTYEMTGRRILHPHP